MGKVATLLLIGACLLGDVAVWKFRSELYYSNLPEFIRAACLSFGLVGCLAFFITFLRLLPALGFKIDGKLVQDPMRILHESKLLNVANMVLVVFSVAAWWTFISEKVTGPNLSGVGYATTIALITMLIQVWLRRTFT